MSKLAIKRDYTETQCKALLLDICENLPEDLLTNLLRANAGYIRQHRLTFVD